jgi:hypothetical protein
MPVTVTKWVETTKQLLGIERKSEMDEATDNLKNLSPRDCEEKGVSLLKLSVADSSTGLYGRIVLVLRPFRRPILPAHRFTVGDIACLTSNKGPSGSAIQFTGVVSRVREHAISVAFEDLGDYEGGQGLGEPLRLDRLANDSTYRKTDAALRMIDRLQSSGGPCARLISVLFHEVPPAPPDKAVPFAPINGNLNPSQLAAISLGLHSKDVALIQGPPGTGKTTMVVELIRQVA